MVTVWWSSAGLIHYSFLNLGETITSEKCAQQIDEMHRKLPCLQPALVNRNGPILFHDHTLHNECFKSWKNWAKKFCLIHHIHLTSHQPTTTSSSILTTFFRENTSTTRRRQKKKCFPRVYWILKHGFFTTGINKLISHWQKCVDCNGPYFD